MVNCRDRTNEFFSTANQLQENLRGSSTSNGYGFYSPLVSQHRKEAQKIALTSGPSSARFSRAASEISHGIHATTLKLESLTKLVQKKSLFDDQPEQIQRQTHVMNEDIRTLNSEIDSLYQYMEQHRKESTSTQSSDHSERIVDALKINLAKTTKAFQEVLHVRTTNLKAQSSRRNKFSSAKSVRHRSPMELHRRAEFHIEEETEGLLEPSEQVNGFEQRQVTVQREDTYLHDRLEAVQNIEQTIAELGQMYQRLATIVARQDEHCVRIDMNTEETMANVTTGYEQLLKYYDSISSNRWLIFKVFFILIIFLVIFVAFIA
uniref:Syntaxin-32-like n=1 Tax=Hirondellea gigas TaxID=1518452 RepID=A0A6A7FX59_9CRUS